MVERTRRNADSEDTGRRESRDRDDVGRDRGRGEDRSSRDSRDSGRDRGDREETRDRGRDRDNRDRDDGGRDRGRDSERGSSRGGSGFRYKPRDADTVTRRAEQGASDYDKFVNEKLTNYKVKDENNIRILPPTWDGAEHYGLDIHVHYGVGADRQSYLCLHKMKGEADPIYEEYTRVKKEIGDSDNKEDKKLISDLRAKSRVLVYLIDRDDEKAGVQIWAMPAGLDQDIVKLCKVKKTGEVLNPDDPDNGYDVSFERNGKGINTKYEGVQLDRNPSRLGKEEWLDFAVENPLPTQLIYYSYEHIAKEFGGKSQHRESDHDDRGKDRDASRDRSRREIGDTEERPDRGRDAGMGGRSRGEREGSARREPEYTWEQIQGMTGQELDDLLEQEPDKLKDVNPKEAKDDADLADWICEELKLRKAETRSRSRESADSESERLAAMRSRIRD